MTKRVYKNRQELRQGYTTGSCAAAAAQAAAYLLLTGNMPSAILLHTPKGIDLRLHPEIVRAANDCVTCSIVKDSGDDPDVTDGITIFSTVYLTDQGVTIDGGSGVGRVTRVGLSVPVGLAAINPGPRTQITNALKKVMEECSYSGGMHAVISAENGETVAKHTYNERLGIIGGISILGTSGIVEPMSEVAIMDTTHLELDSVYASGQPIAFLCPGNYGVDFARDTLKLNLDRSTKTSNFIGDAIDYAAYKGFQKILLVGHAGKIVKIAAGVMNTHSYIADGRQEIFTAHAALCGASHEVLEKIMSSVTIDACIEILDAAGLREAVMERIGSAIEKRLAARLRGKAEIEYITFTNQYGLIACSAGALELCKQLQELL